MFENRLREIRVIKKKTQWWLSVHTGINQSKISLIERGYLLPRKHEVEKISGALGVSPEEIFPFPVKEKLDG